MVSYALSVAKHPKGRVSTSHTYGHGTDIGLDRNSGWWEHPAEPASRRTSLSQCGNTSRKRKPNGPHNCHDSKVSGKKRSLPGQGSYFPEQLRCTVQDHPTNNTDDIHTGHGSAAESFILRGEARYFRLPSPLPPPDRHFARTAILV